MRADRVLAVLRDGGCILLGLAGIAHQQITGQIHAELLAVYMGLLGAPTIPALLALRSGARRADQDTADQVRQQAEANGTGTIRGSSSPSSRRRSSRTRSSEPREGDQ